MVNKVLSIVYLQDGHKYQVRVKVHAITEFSVWGTFRTKDHMSKRWGPLMPVSHFLWQNIEKFEKLKQTEL